MIVVNLRFDLADDRFGRGFLCLRRFGCEHHGEGHEKGGRAIHGRTALSVLFRFCR